MQRFSKKLVTGLTAAAVAVVIPLSLAYACVALVAFRVEGSPVVQPGGTVKVFVGEFAARQPVEIRLDSATGPVLATAPLPTATMTGFSVVDVPIPASITPGVHTLYTTQTHYDMNVGNVARAAIYVGTSPPAAPTPEVRATSLDVSEAPGAGGYVVLGLGVAAAGLVLAGVASFMASRRPAPKPARA